jgi:hypothetical protein
MAWAGFHYIANYRASILRLATTRITAWQSALKCTADFQPPPSDLIRTQRMAQTCGNPLSNLDFGLWQSAVRQFLLWQSAEFTPRSANTGLKI